MMHGDYERGADAANRALDRSVLNASDLLVQARASEQRYREQENTAMAEWNKGYADTVQEFLDDKAR